jgi:hypothetical protein
MSVDANVGEYRTTVSQIRHHSKLKTNYRCRVQLLQFHHRRMNPIRNAMTPAFEMSKSDILTGKQRRVGQKL